MAYNNANKKNHFIRSLPVSENKSPSSEEDSPIIQQGESEYLLLIRFFFISHLLLCGLILYT